jgi:predicted Fe-Mo cluster-binding NifX family protein
MKRTSVLMIGAICLLAVVAASAVSARSGKIAVAADGKSSAATVSSVAARSPFFLMFGQDGKFLEAVANPHKDAGRNASGLVTAFLSDNGVSDVIAGAFGDKMKNALKQKGIASFEWKGSSAVDAVKRYLMK